MFHLPNSRGFIFVLRTTLLFPQKMKTKYLLFLIALAIYISCSKPALSGTEVQNNLQITEVSNTQSPLENELFKMVNAHRTAVGLTELIFEGTSYYYAKEHTDYMISKGQTSHAKFGERAEKIAEQTGAKKVSENVAKDYENISIAMAAWLDSPDHRKNIEGNYTHSALSIKADTEGQLYFTQIFLK